MKKNIVGLCMFFAVINFCVLAQSQRQNVMEAPTVGRRVILSGAQRTVQQSVTISGVVEDETGAAIPAAKLTLTNKSRVDVTKNNADGAGAFTFQNVLPGKYVLRGEAKNFTTTELAVTVATTPIVALKLQLKIAVQADEITISSSGKSEEESVSLDRNADRLNFDDTMLKGLPTSGQNVLPVLGSFLSAAAQGTDGPNIVVDGVEASGLDIPTRALRRARINRNPYSAEFRKPGKARIEIATEEGSMKRYHAGFGFYYRNAIFDARNAFAATRPDMSRKLFDGNFSGPLVNKRVGFFVSGERLLNDESAVINAQTLVGALRANIFTPQRRTNFLGRVDIRAGEKHAVTVFYNFRDETEHNRGIGGLKLAEQGYHFAERLHRVQFSDRTILSAHWLNDLRVVAEHNTTQVGALPNGASIHVIGAFTGGAAQKYQVQRETTFRVQDIASYSRGNQSLKFGAELRPRKINAIEGSNFGGTFEFSNLNQLAAGTPFLYRVNQGNPAINFTQTEFSAFVQNDIRLRPNFSITPGLRYTWQANLRDKNNVAPRLAFAWAPRNGKTVIRGGAGIFHDRLPETATLRARLYDGNNLREIVIANPSYPNPTGQITARPVSTITIAPNVRAPYVTQAGVSVEREVWKKSLLTVEYQHLRGNGLLRSHNVNAPLAGVRPNANFLNINQVESSAQMRSNALSVSWRGNMGKRIKGMAQYTYAQTFDNTSGVFYLPANNYDLQPEWGRSDFDQRHRFSFVGTVDLPWRLRAGTFVTLASGIPYDITTGFDNNGDSLANDRPLGVRRNAGLGAGLAKVDLRLTKALNVPRLFDRQRERQSQNLEISVDFFNLFNRVNFNNFMGAQSSPFFGRANSAQAARTIQLSTRYRF